MPFPKPTNSHSSHWRGELRDAFETLILEKFNLEPPKDALITTEARVQRLKNCAKEAIKELTGQDTNLISEVAKNINGILLQFKTEVFKQPPDKITDEIDDKAYQSFLAKTLAEFERELITGERGRLHAIADTKNKLVEDIKTTFKKQVSTPEDAIKQGNSLGEIPPENYINAQARNETISADWLTFIRSNLAGLPPATGMDPEARAKLISQASEKILTEVLEKGLLHMNGAAFYSNFLAGAKGIGQGTEEAQLSGGTVEQTEGGKHIDQGLPFDILCNLVGPAAAKYIWDRISVEFAANMAILSGRDYATNTQVIGDTIHVVVNPKDEVDILEQKTWCQLENPILTAGKVKLQVHLIESSNGQTYAVDREIRSLGADTLRQMQSRFQEELKESSETAAALREEKKKEGFQSGLHSEMFIQDQNSTDRRHLIGLPEEEIKYVKAAFKEAIRSYFIDTPPTSPTQSDSLSRTDSASSLSSEASKASEISHASSSTNRGMHAGLLQSELQHLAHEHMVKNNFGKMDLGAYADGKDITAELMRWKEFLERPQSRSGSEPQYPKIIPKSIYQRAIELKEKRVNDKGDLTRAQANACLKIRSLFQNSQASKMDDGNPEPSKPNPPKNSM